MTVSQLDGEQAFALPAGTGSEPVWSREEPDKRRRYFHTHLFPLAASNAENRTMEERSWR